MGNPGALATELEHSRRRLSEIEVRYDEEISRFRSLQQARQDLQLGSPYQIFMKKLYT